MSEWQKIETAPKGELIIGYDADGMMRLVFWEADEWLTVGMDFSSYWFEPTHWMPLPKPPTNQIEGGES